MHQGIAGIEATLVAQRTTKDTAQAATRARNAAMSALNRWMRDSLEVSRVARAD